MWNPLSFEGEVRETDQQKAFFSIRPEDYIIDEVQRDMNTIDLLKVSTPESTTTEKISLTTAEKISLTTSAKYFVVIILSLPCLYYFIIILSLLFYHYLAVIILSLSCLYYFIIILSLLFYYYFIIIILSLLFCLFMICRSNNFEVE
jgi:hypothetical protein